MLLKKDKSDKSGTQTGSESGAAPLPEVSITAAGEETLANTQLTMAATNNSDPTTPMSERQPSPGTVRTFCKFARRNYHNILICMNR